jgi:hypothetical protein
MQNVMMLRLSMSQLMLVKRQNLLLKMQMYLKMRQRRQRLMIQQLLKMPQLSVRVKQTGTVHLMLLRYIILWTLLQDH